VPLPRGEWIETWSGARVRGGVEATVETPLARIPVWVRSGSIVVSYPAEHVARGLGDAAETERPLVATMWGEPHSGATAVRLSDRTRISWRRGEWSVTPDRDVSFREV
jgi:alpha-glucosidase (family GH31 glycosyl hydrolase)